MGKYDPLKVFLASQAQDRVAISFAEIERLVGSPLPSSKRHPAWWSNNPSNNPMTRAWLAAGYKTEQVDTAAQQLVFRRVPTPSADDSSDGWLASLRAALGGTVHVAPGYDLTEPTGEMWDAENE